MTTSAPASANAFTIERPSPRLPPVTTATLPLRSNNSSGRTRSPFLRELAGRAPGSGRSCKCLRDRHPLFRKWTLRLHRGVGEVPPLRDHETEVEGRTAHSILGILRAPRPRGPIGRIELDAH